MATSNTVESKGNASSTPPFFLRWIFGDPQETFPDPVTGLSQRDRNYIIDTWTLIRRDIRANSMALFVALFARYPEYQRIFPTFATVPLHELPRNEVVKAHALVVFYFFTNLVEAMDDSDLMTELVRKNVRNHLRRPMGPQNFANMAELLVEVMQDRLRSRMTPGAVRAWKTLLAFCQKVTVEVYAEHKRAIEVGKPRGILSPPAQPPADK
ncbi:globin-like [Dermacentor andersoni]|uniref:globin-like n=1 Tax=Dermacentor andersoni TaxID=34620 RepID=UPI003B3B2486